VGLHFEQNFLESAIIDHDHELPTPKQSPMPFLQTEYMTISSVTGFNSEEERFKKQE
jgi:hypothetical protein